MLGLCCKIEVARTSGLQSSISYLENKVFKGSHCEDKDNQMRANKGCLFLACWSWGVPSISSIWQRLKAGRGGGKLYPRKKGKASNLH